MAPISPGTLLAGRFRLEDLLEETGGARFWRATDLTLMRDVAVHVIDESDPRAQALLSAARTSATVGGSHLLRVLDAAVEDGVAYVVNEWGNGVSMDRMLMEGPLPARRAAWMVREVADAIADAHRHGVAHGRLIPENVLVNENGSVKLIGFVVDGVLHGGSGSDISEHESDVLNLAALLYAGLVGRWPGTPGTTIPAAPRDHGRVMRPRQVRAGVPKPLDRVCDNVLNRSDPHFPIETAHEIKAALSDYLGEAADGFPVGRHSAESVEEVRLNLPSTGDPEATQAGAPRFDDEATSWVPATPDVEHTQIQVPQPSTKTPYVGMGGGMVPPTWGPDAHRPIAPEPAWESDESGTPWLRLAGLVAAVILLLVAVVFAFNLGRGGSDKPAAHTTPGHTSTAGSVLTMASVRDFDPFQDSGVKEENPDEVGASHDGNPSTAWTTLTYKDGPDLTVYKPGVGLLVDLGSVQKVGSVQVTLQGTPTTVQLLASDADLPPTTTTGLAKVAEAKDAGTSATLEPTDAVDARYLVVWLTALPKAPGGYRGAVAEIVVRS